MQHFDNILRRVADGETLSDACAAVGLKRQTLNKHLRARPDLRARLDAAKPLSGKALVLARFDEIIAAIRNGATAVGAVESFGCTGVSFFKVIKTDAALKARFVAATADREDGDNAIGKSATGRWSDEDFDRALDALRADPKAGFHRVLVDGLPTPFLVLDKAKRDPYFRERLLEVVGERAKRRAGMKRQPPRQYETDLLRRALMSLDLFRIADKASAGLDPADREDVASEIIVAVLEGEIALDEIKTKGRKLARSRVFGSVPWSRSLDELQFDSHNAQSLGDTIANDDGIIFY